MANLFLRLSSSFACNSANLVGKRKKKTVFVHIVLKVHLERTKISSLLKCSQKSKKDEPEKTKKDEAPSSSFWVRLSSFFAYFQIMNKFEFF